MSLLNKKTDLCRFQKDQHYAQSMDVREVCAVADVVQTPSQAYILYKVEKCVRVQTETSWLLFPSKQKVYTNLAKKILRR